MVHVCVPLYACRSLTRKVSTPTHRLLAVGGIMRYVSCYPGDTPSPLLVTTHRLDPRAPHYGLGLRD